MVDLVNLQKDSNRKCKCSLGGRFAGITTYLKYNSEMKADERKRDILVKIKLLG